MVKRKYPRFSIEENVIVALQNGINRIGKVKDISLGGLSFEHIYEEDLMGGDSRKSLTVWINDVNLPKIPCRIVYDHPLQTPSEYDSFTIRLITKRCGIQFESLTDQQIAQLELFLKTYAQEET
ncbi:MAG: PilZ domain-containing protein [Deltaproteobacteria bacterium]|nr:PilZ domain-containing protein [Deltaproteobacteria bacterium]